MNTPNPPLYSGCNPPRNVPDSGHHGLWYERFFNQYDRQWQIYREGKLEWIRTVEGNVGDTDTLLQAAIDRLVTLCKENLSGKFDVFTAPWHFVTGLGNPHPVENGFLWHPTLGAPYIPGAAVKGLVRAWVEAWMDFNDDAARASTLHRWFGSEDKDPKVCDSEAGAFIFFDALPIKRVKLKADIMTPHYGDWYEKGSENPKEDGSNVPADWHSPVPIPFLVADKPTFMFAIAPRNDGENVEELDDVMKALASALECLGAGAKTAVGYGHLSEDRDAKKAIDRRIERAAMPEEQRLVAEIREEKEERMIAEVKKFTPKQLAKMFSKDFNKTRKVKSDSWKDFVKIVWEVHGEMISPWKDSPDENKKKAYKKLCSEWSQL